ncbi:MAG: hypothetical protein ACFCGT_00055 [Sandaracinaceae bacterium]
MLDALVQQFIQSDVAKDAIGALTQQTELDQPKAEEAVRATAEGAAEAAASGEVGLDDLLGSLTGGGGLAGMIGSFLGSGDAPAAGGQAASPANPMVDMVARIVSDKTGLGLPIATTVTALVLPKVLEYFKNSAGGTEGGGGLGSLFGS